MSGGAAVAQNADDARRVAQCIHDNAGQRTTAGALVSEAAKAAYCACMVRQMSDSETRSVTQWERANPAIARQYSANAGWN